MKKLFFILSTILLTSCVSVGNIQGECEDTYTKFKDIYDCTKPKLMEEFQYHEEFQKVKMYLLEGALLNEQIDKGEISEIEAKAKWQKLYLDLGKADRDAPN